MRCKTFKLNPVEKINNKRDKLVNELINKFDYSYDMSMHEIEELISSKEFKFMDLFRLIKDNNISIILNSYSISSNIIKFRNNNAVYGIEHNIFEIKDDNDLFFSNYFCCDIESYMIYKDKNKDKFNNIYHIINSILTSSFKEYNISIGSIKENLQTKDKLKEIIKLLQKLHRPLLSYLYKTSSIGDYKNIKVYSLSPKNNILLSSNVHYSILLNYKIPINFLPFKDATFYKTDDIDLKVPLIYYPDDNKIVILDLSLREDKNIDIKNNVKYEFNIMDINKGVDGILLFCKNLINHVIDDDTIQKIIYSYAIESMQKKVISFHYSFDEFKHKFFIKKDNIVCDVSTSKISLFNALNNKYFIIDDKEALLTYDYNFIEIKDDKFSINELSKIILYNSKEYLSYANSGYEILANNLHISYNKYSSEIEDRLDTYMKDVIFNKNEYIILKDNIVNNDIVIVKDFYKSMNDIIKCLLPNNKFFAITDGSLNLKFRNHCCDYPFCINDLDLIFYLYSSIRLYINTKELNIDLPLTNKLLFYRSEYDDIQQNDYEENYSSYINFIMLFINTLLFHRIIDENIYQSSIIYDDIIDEMKKYIIELFKFDIDEKDYYSKYDISCLNIYTFNTFTWLYKNIKDTLIDLVSIFKSIHKKLYDPFDPLNRIPKLVLEENINYMKSNLEIQNYINEYKIIEKDINNKIEEKLSIMKNSFIKNNIFLCDMYKDPINLFTELDYNFNTEFKINFEREIYEI